MHIFDYQEIPSTLLIPEIVNMLSALHEFKGKQELYIETEPDVLTALLDIARIQSTKASNKIEGIYTSDERLEALVMEKQSPVTARRKRLPDTGKFWRQYTKVMNTSRFVPTTYCNCTVTCTVSAKAVRAANSRTRTMSLRNRERTESSGCVLPPSRHFRHQKRWSSFVRNSTKR